MCRTKLQGAPRGKTCARALPGATEQHEPGGLFLLWNRSAGR